MFYYKFTYPGIKDFHQVDKYFNHYFQDSWIEDNPLAKVLLDKIDNSEWLGGGLLYQRMLERRYNFTGICHGTKTIILQKYFPDKWMRITAIGENIYPLLDQCPWDLHFIGKTNLHYWGELNGYPFTIPIYLVDYDAVIHTAEEFDDYYHRWRFE